MTKSSAYHSTMVLGRAFDATVARLYAALSDPAERALVGAAGDATVVVLDEADFRVGGREAFRFGSRINPRFRGQSLYHDIVPERRIVSTDMVYEREQLLSITVATLELEGEGCRTRVKLTAQIAWLDGADALDEPTLRYDTLLANLERHVGRAVRGGRRSLFPG
jgi:uncharacterized protein YndB with AHSA1/START domain